ncbi:MAG: hypothetical protein HYV13_04435 [Candidatus Doudnabacteria bacterium]|nr:hypothetical protein [Candidatus Doudnabacteria bacterium]
MEAQTTQAHGRRRPSPSEPVIPSVRGEFYNYSAEFSTGRPLCYLFKCKANKSRPLEEAVLIDHEIDLVFSFGSEVHACSPSVTVDLLDDVVNVGLSHTLIARAGMTEDRFHYLRQQKNGDLLAQVCRAMTTRGGEVVTLSPGTILAVRTESGKYGLFLVKEVTPSAVKVDACHILL